METGRHGVERGRTAMGASPALPVAASSHRPVPPSPRRPVTSVWVHELGLVAYQQAVVIQQELVQRRLADEIPDTLLLLEHPPVLTMGRRGTWDHILQPPARLAVLGVEVCESQRGGLVTYHGPGQLVAYPIVRLRGVAADVPSYVAGLEEAVIRTLEHFGMKAERRTGCPGVWANGGKIAAIGIAMHRGIAYHGVAVNLQPDLSHFDLIDACGVGSLGVTSFRQETGRELYPSTFASHFADSFGDVFALQTHSTKEAPPVGAATQP